MAHLKIRIYGAYKDEVGNLTAREYLPHEIYKVKNSN